MLQVLLEPIFIILLFLLALILAWLVAISTRRRRMLAGLAVRWRMRFTYRHSDSWPAQLAQAYCLQLGHSLGIYNIISGRRHGHQVMFFDYRFETGIGQDRSVHNGSIITCSADMVLPSAVALRDDVFEPMGRFQRFAPLKHPNPLFAQRFHLYTDQPGDLNKLLCPDLLRLLTRCQGVDWEFCDKYLLFFTDQLQSPTQISRLLTRAVQSCRIISPHHTD